MVGVMKLGKLALAGLSAVAAFAMVTGTPSAAKAEDNSCGSECVEALMKVVTFVADIRYDMARMDCNRQFANNWSSGTDLQNCYNQASLGWFKDMGIGALTVIGGAAGWNFIQRRRSYNA
jgi:hypothetical protein